MADLAPDRARILVVDDEPANVLLLERVLARAGYRAVRSTTDSRQALRLFQEFEPDLVLLDLRMPNMDGFAVMEQLRPRIPLDAYLPILVLTADVTSEAKEKALSGGAHDFLTKPLDATEVVLRIHNLLQTRALHLALHGEKVVLEEQVAERTHELDLARLEMLERLSRAAEYRDFDTGRHAERVGQLSALLAEALGWSGDRVTLMRQAAPLHDIGKIGISDAILLKPEGLTPPEYHVIKSHTAIGGELLSGSRSPLLQLAEQIARYHHERWDGTGYLGMTGDAIPLAARIVSVADVFDALTHDRPYRPAWPVERVLDHLREQSGTAFDPDVVTAFLRIQPTLPAAFLEPDPMGPVPVGLEVPENVVAPEPIAAPAPARASRRGRGAATPAAAGAGNGATPSPNGTVTEAPAPARKRTRPAKTAARKSGEAGSTA